MSEGRPKTAWLKEPVPALNATLSMMRVVDRMEAYLQPCFEPYGITMQQFNVLRVLYVRETDVGVPCNEIGRRLIQRVPDVTRLLDRLEREELIVRERCPKDRRVVRSRLTEKGQAIVEDIHGPLLERHIESMAHLTVEEVETLDALLRKVGKPLGAEPPP